MTIFGIPEKGKANHNSRARAPEIQASNEATFLSAPGAWAVIRSHAHRQQQSGVCRSKFQSEGFTFCEISVFQCLRRGSNIQPWILQPSQHLRPSVEQ